MFRQIDIIAVSRNKRGAYAELVAEYGTRIRWPLKIHEIEARSTEAAKAQIEEQEKILKLIKPQATVIVLDERGDGLRSTDFAKTLEHFAQNGENHLQFIIGGADGLMDDVRGKADILLSFGKQTWPHLLARIMLLEQIYRAQQILSGHPYHRE